MWPFLPAPGADDDGSGSVTILEAYRALIAADFRPERTVQFHWYSAEEGGLLGSQAVAQDYEKRSVNVLAMSQRGMREEVGIITDFVDPQVTQLNKELVDMYLDIPYVETKCGYACSDQLGLNNVPAELHRGAKLVIALLLLLVSYSIFPGGVHPTYTSIESAFENSNKNIHSVNDRIDVSDEFSFDHMLEFSKLAVAFAVELGGWSK
ncbi:hypothetical protein H0H93_008328 [Arthromyces matolae]|nr:hypothetical protein H0H93_008328 [Arthromyces matolae]